jgi:Putative MetA-pathway of phenol degradation
VHFALKTQRTAVAKWRWALVVASASLGTAASAQHLTPRAYWPAPVGTDVLILGYQHNTGDVVIDPSLPISGVDSNIDYFQVAYQRSLRFFGRSASAQISLPYADGVTRGNVVDQFMERHTAGAGDTSFRFAVNLKGAPAMNAEEFSALRQNPKTLVGASVIVQMPTGDYDPSKLINLSTNRWAIKPAVGLVAPIRPAWLFEAEIGVWLFGDNDSFLGVTRKQEKIVSTELHVIKRVRPGFWLALDANYYAGGETKVGEEIREDLQRNSRAGFTVVFPIKGRHAIRGSYSTGVSTRSGGDFDIVSFSYLYAW